MTAAVKNIRSDANNLQVQKSYAEYQQELTRLTNCAWQVVYTALWNTKQFSAAETEIAKAFISSFLHQANSHKIKYLEFVERVLLARIYVSSHPGKYIPLPSDWFSTKNTNGFMGTEKWYKAMQQTRAALPLYRQPLKAFAEAISETTQTGLAKDFHYWRSYFIQQNTNRLLNLYLSTIANFSFCNK